MTHQGEGKAVLWRYYYSAHTRRWTRLYGGHTHPAYAAKRGQADAQQVHKLKAIKALARAHNSENEYKQLLDAGMASGRHRCKTFHLHDGYVAEK